LPPSERQPSLKPEDRRDDNSAAKLRTRHSPTRGKRTRNELPRKLTPSRRAHDRWDCRLFPRRRWRWYPWRWRWRRWRCRRDLNSGAVFAGTRTNNFHQGTLWYVGEQVVEIKVAAFSHSKQSGASIGVCVIAGNLGDASLADGGQQTDQQSLVASTGCRAKVKDPHERATYTEYTFSFRGCSFQESQVLRAPAGWSPVLAVVSRARGSTGWPLRSLYAHLPSLGTPPSLEIQHQAVPSPQEPQVPPSAQAVLAVHQ
jgi:hypothetical protein